MPDFPRPAPLPVLLPVLLPALLPALATATLIASATAPWAQEAGFAVELSQAPGSFEALRVTVHQFGPAVEPASGYVRGCRGHVAGEGAAALFDLPERLDTLAFTAHGAGLVSLVVETPDGLFRCAHAEDGATAVAQIAGAAAGRYRVWAGVEEDAAVAAQIVAADRPISGIELTGLDFAQLGAPRSGRHLFTATPETGRQILVAGGRLFPEEPMIPLSGEYCPGYSRLDAADAVLVLDEPERRLSVFALSERDLTLAVAAPDGRVLCNDDAYGLNPAVTFEAAPDGEYHVFVGAFGSGRTGDLYDLYATPGAPQFGEPGAEPEGPPRMGYLSHDPRRAARGQHLATGTIVAAAPVDDLVPGQFCSGHVGTDAPDVVLTVTDPAEALSLYALSTTDLVIAVRGPDGEWLCNDDSQGINPAVTFDGALPGDYHVFVGAFALEAEGVYALFAADGAPNWEAAQTAAPETLNAQAEPELARIPFGPQTRPDPRFVFDIARSSFEAFGLGDDCAGYIDPTRPDLVIAAGADLAQIMVYMVADVDGTLAVVGPDGTLYCNDDFEGLHPGILIPYPDPGDYAIFAGSFDGSGGPATLGVTVSNPVWTMDREG